MVIPGRRIIEGRLLFAEIRYAVLACTKKLSVSDCAHGKILAGKNLYWQGKKLAGKTPVLVGLAGIILMKVR